MGEGLVQLGQGGSGVEHGLAGASQKPSGAYGALAAALEGEIAGLKGEQAASRRPGFLSEEALEELMGTTEATLNGDFETQAEDLSFITDYGIRNQRLRSPEEMAEWLLRLQPFVQRFLGGGTGDPVRDFVVYLRSNPRER